MKHETADQFELGHEALGITAEEHRLLKQFIDDAESGVIMDDQFTMGTACGTACCIGGYTGILVKNKNRSESVIPLFYPPIGRAWGAGLKQGVAAVRAFLRGAGDRCWHEVYGL